MNNFTTLQDIEDALQFLNCSDRDVWVNAAFQIKSEFGESGFDIWNHWSQGYEKYKASTALGVWRSAKMSGRTGTTTIASLIYLAKQNGYSPRSYSDEDKKRFAAECEARRERVEKERAADEAWRVAMAEKIAAVCAELVTKHCKKVGKSKYLGAKKVGPSGALFPKHGVILVVDVRTAECYMVTGRDAISAFFKDRDPELSIRYIKPGTLVLPLFDDAGNVRNVQVIFEDGGKKFIKFGEKSGLYFEIPGDDSRALACEGFATGASLSAASGNRVFVTFDCGNLVNCAHSIRGKVGDNTPLFFCGDDDVYTEGNPGRKKAMEAAQCVGGFAVFPTFPEDDTQKLTDFNDLQVCSGLSAVTEQLNAAFERFTNHDFPPAPIVGDAPSDDSNHSHIPETLPEVSRPTLEVALGRYAFCIDDTKIWDNRASKFIKRPIVKDFLGAELFNTWLNHAERRNVSAADMAPIAARAATKGAGGLTAALDRYVYLNPSQNAWDTVEKKVVAINDLRCAIAACYADWIKHPQRREIRADNLVFDPTQRKMGPGYINRFRGIQLEPFANDDGCKNILKLVWVLCNQEKEAFWWLIRWLAYPLQNIGAKMTTAVLMHSDVHGSGKSMLFDYVMREIYGEYCRTFDQKQLESSYNDWISECLFGVFEEVLSRGQKYSHTGTLKQMITGKKFRVEKKFLSGWEESNHMNCAFLSNEVQPLPIEPSDRRFLVIWPESKLLDDLKTGVDDEMRNGGAAAFYDYLLRVNTNGFGPYTEPPMTEAKERIIDFGRPTWEQFFIDWKNDELEIPFISVLIGDLYKEFDRYCRKRNEHCMGQNKFTSFVRSKLKMRRDIRYEHYVQAGKGTFFVVGDPPGDMSQKEWFGRCVAQWRDAVQKMLGAN